MTTQTAILIGLAIYGGIMLAISFYWMTKVKKASDYLLAGRGLPYWVLTGTTVGTCIGTGVVIGSTGLAYKHGWAGSAYSIGLGLGTVLAGLCFASMRRFSFMTLSEELSCYFAGNRTVQEFANISLFISQLCWLTVQIMGGAAMLGVVTDFSPAMCTLLSGLITAAISLPGGLKSVVYTDFLQAAILLGGFGILGFNALEKSGGMAGLQQAVPAPYSSFLGVESFGTWGVVSMIITIVLGIMADPGRRLTMYSANTVAGAKWSMVTAGLIVIGFSVVVGIVGMYTFKLNPNLPTSDQALPWLVMNVLPPWLASVVVVSVASAIFSSANGNAAAAGTYYVRHIHSLFTGHYAKDPLRAVRIALACVFVVSTAVALNSGSIVGFVLNFLPVTMSGLGVALVFGRFWPRSTWQGALGALIVTPLVSLAVQFIPSLGEALGRPIIPAAIAGSTVLVIVSLVTPRNTRSLEDVSEVMRQEREQVEK